MSSITPSSSPGDGPQESKRVDLALAGSYAAGYSAALGVGAGLSPAMTLSQVVAATLCWFLWRRLRS